MSDFTELRDDLAAIAKAVDGYSATAITNLLEQSRQIDRLWTDNAELRDEMNAVANRVESLTRAVMADPAEVARAIVNDANQGTLAEVQPYPLCRCGHRHDHHRHHEPGKGCYRCESCYGYNPWPVEAAS